MGPKEDERDHESPTTDSLSDFEQSLWDALDADINETIGGDDEDE